MTTTPQAIQTTDPAEQILRSAQGVDDDARANAWDAFHQSETEDDLAGKLQNMKLPDDVKANLWDAKHSARQPAKVNPAQRSGNYQQTPGGAIRNANDEAAKPFSDSTTSVIPSVGGTQATGALMKRQDETDSQFMHRAIEAGKHVTPEQIEQEQRANNARVLPTVGAAVAAGPAMLA
jgi:hypothetical protein